MSKTETTLAFSLRCRHCGCEGSMVLQLGDLTEVTCDECSDTSEIVATAEMFRDQAAQWEALAKWVKAAGVFIERASEAKDEDKEGGEA